MHDAKTVDIVVIGGGLAGLATATYLARAGKVVTLFEKAREVGGRAVTQPKEDFRLNLGPHALYLAGAGVKILDELGVRFRGGVPHASGGYALYRGEKHTLPGGFVSLLTTGLLRLPAKFELARLLGSVAAIDTQAMQHLTVSAWLENAIRHPEIRGLIQALFRLTTYGNDPHHQSAGAALAQLQRALARNVFYVDGGWQVLVDGLRAAAETAGVHVVSGAKVDAITYDQAVHGVRLADGTFHPTSSVIIAASPADAARLVQVQETNALHTWAKTVRPVRAACLDLALTRLPRPKARFALGIDQPLYFSVHSAVAKLGPEGGAVIHAAKYLDPAIPTHPHTDERELEALLDTMQPGWREVLAARRFLPHLTVSNALVTAAAGGTEGRPGPEVPDIRTLYVVGDWVGPEGMLVDASLASAKRAAELVLQRVDGCAVVAA